MIRMAANNKILIAIFVVVLPVVIIGCVSIVLFMILPNADISEVTVKKTGATNHSEIDRDGQVHSYSNSNNHLFVIGLVFACALFVFLIVAVITAFILFQQAQGYVTERGHQGQNFHNATENGNCQLTGQRKLCNSDLRLNQNTDFIPDQTKIPSSVDLYDQDNPTFKDSESVVVEERGCIQKVRPQSYGTLNRTRFMSSVDEDGYHVDNFDYELKESPGIQGEGETNELDKEVESILTHLEEDLQAGASTIPSPPPPPTPLQRQLTKQDTFEGLPPLKSFDNYLTLVRIDSTSSFDSSLEQSKAQWTSFEEPDTDKEESQKEDTI